MTAIEQHTEVHPGISLRTLTYAPPHERSQPTANRPAFLLVHGLASNALLWHGVASALADRGEVAVTVDLRGHGRSSKPDGAYDVCTVADDLAALIDQLGLVRPVVAGQSWGGNVVVELAARHQKITRGIVPVDGGFIDLSAQFTSWEACASQLAPPRFAGTPATTFETWMRDAHPAWPESGIAGMMGNVEVHDDGTVSPWLSFERHLQVLRGLYDHRPAERYPLVSVPVWWMIAGSEDGTGDESWSGRKVQGINAALAGLSVAQCTWFPGADHDLHAQHPEQVADLLVSGINEGWFAE